MKQQERERYLAVLKEMLSVTVGSYPTVTLRNYLAQLERKYGDAFDPNRALDDLIANAKLLKREFDKVAW